MNIFLIYDIVYVRSVYQKLCSGNDRSSTIEFFFLFFCVPNKNSRELGDLHFLPFLTCWWPAFVQFTWKQNSISFIFIMFPYNMTLVERKNSYCASSSKTTNQALNTSSELGSYVAAQPFLCNKTQFNLLSTNNMMDFICKVWRIVVFISCAAFCSAQRKKSLGQFVKSNYFGTQMAIISSSPYTV